MTVHVDPPHTGTAATPPRSSPRSPRRGSERPTRGTGRGLPEPQRTQRRRLVLASAPLIVLLVLIGARLVTLNAVHDRTLAAYEAGDRAGTLEWAGRQGWVNLVEPFRASFAMGAGHVVGGRFDLARTWFEQALDQVPRGGVDECKVRVNLGLTYERLGDDATARERPDEARQFYEKGIRVTKERPPVCDVPETGGQTGSRLQDAQQRMEGKSEATPPVEGNETTEGTPPAPSEPPPPTPDPQRAPSEEQQEQLEQEQRENTAERNRELGNDGRGIPNGQGELYPKPW